MATVQERYEAKVDSLLRRFGEVDGIDLYRFVSMTTNQYKQGAKTFATAVALTGRITLDPTADDLSLIGAEEDVEAMFVVSRLELIRKLPTLPEDQWITNDDEIGFEGERYRITRVWLAGKVATRHTHVVVTLKTRPGAANSPPP